MILEKHPASIIFSCKFRGKNISGTLKNSPSIINEILKINSGNDVDFFRAIIIYCVKNPFTILEHFKIHIMDLGDYIGRRSYTLYYLIKLFLYC